MAYKNLKINLNKLPGIVAGLSMLFTCNIVNAGLIGVKTIEISNSNTTGDYWLQLSEINALDMFGQDVALSSMGATASAPDQWNHLTSPGNAIDGNTSGSYAASQIFHEGSDHSRDTLTITLASITELSELTLWGRTDCCSFRDIYDVSFFDIGGNNLFSLTNLDATGSNHNVTRTLPDTNPVPEPSILALFGAGILGLGFVRRRKLRQV